MKAIGLDRDRLGKLLGLLGSDFEGEIAAAGRAANALVRGAGLTWLDIVAPPPALDAGRKAKAKSKKRSATPPPRTTARERGAYCLAAAEFLTAWERDFCASIAGQAYRLTAKQEAVLDRLVTKVMAATRRVL